jgi:hypothetical protein
MSEDEAIEYVKEILKYPKLYAWTEKEEDFLRGIDKAKIETILDLYNKEKEKNRTLEELLQGRLFELYNYYKDLAGCYQANSIGKDKIKAKIEELKDLNSKFSQRVIKAKELYLTELVQNILKELLEEE